LRQDPARLTEWFLFKIVTYTEPILDMFGKVQFYLNYSAG